MGEKNIYSAMCCWHFSRVCPRIGCLHLRHLLVFLVLECEGWDSWTVLSMALCSSPTIKKETLHIWSNYNQTPAFLPLPLQRKGQYYLASHRDHAYTFRSIYQLLLSTEYTRTKLSKLRPVQVSMCHFQSYCTWNFNRW